MPLRPLRFQSWILKPGRAGETYATLKQDFALAKEALAADAVAQGATDGGATAVLEAYHATLVAPFCLAATQGIFRQSIAVSMSRCGRGELQVADAVAATVGNPETIDQSCGWLAITTCGQSGATGIRRPPGIRSPLRRV